MRVTFNQLIFFSSYLWKENCSYVSQKDGICLQCFCNKRKYFVDYVRGVCLQICYLCYLINFHLHTSFVKLVLAILVWFDLLSLKLVIYLGFDFSIYTKSCLVRSSKNYSFYSNLCYRLRVL